MRIRSWRRTIELDEIPDDLDNQSASDDYLEGMALQGRSGVSRASSFAATWACRPKVLACWREGDASGPLSLCPSDTRCCWDSGSPTKVFECK